ncbi:MAG: hypothetical protein GXP04_12665 [Alphaproteobacteria bacterium]|nr:hypothetical protein [Alphaproteobacteria bacterium]
MSKAGNKIFRFFIRPLLLFCVLSSCAEAIEDDRAIAFRDDCAITLGDFQITQEKLLSAGWVSVGVDAHSELNAVMSYAKNLDAKLLEVSSYSYYQKSINTDEMFLVLTHVPTQGAFVNGCYLYDFDATKADASKVIEEWLGEPPTETLFHPDLIQQRKWVSPKSLPKMATVRVGLVFEGGSVAEDIGFSGAMWAATAIAN